MRRVARAIDSDSPKNAPFSRPEGKAAQPGRSAAPKMTGSDSVQRVPPASG